MSANKLKTMPDYNTLLKHILLTLNSRIRSNKKIVDYRTPLQPKNSLWAYVEIFLNSVPGKKSISIQRSNITLTDHCPM